jgi:hypothetical protein
VTGMLVAGRQAGRASGRGIDEAVALPRSAAGVELPLCELSGGDFPQAKRASAAARTAQAGAMDEVPRHLSSPVQSGSVPISGSRPASYAEQRHQPAGEQREACRFGDLLGYRRILDPEVRFVVLLVRQEFEQDIGQDAIARRPVEKVRIGARDIVD